MWKQVEVATYGEATYCISGRVDFSFVHVVLFSRRFPISGQLALTVATMRVRILSVQKKVKLFSGRLRKWHPVRDCTRPNIHNAIKAFKFWIPKTKVDEWQIWVAGFSVD